MSDGECVCKGNWRALVKEYEGQLGKGFLDENGDRWKFFGLVHADDDYYYGMWRKGELRLLSCVGSIEGMGYEPEITATPA